MAIWYIFDENAVNQKMKKWVIIWKIADQNLCCLKSATIYTKILKLVSFYIIAHCMLFGRMCARVVAADDVKRQKAACLGLLELSAAKCTRGISRREVGRKWFGRLRNDITASGGAAAFYIHTHSGILCMHVQYKLTQHKHHSTKSPPPRSFPL